MQKDYMLSNDHLYDKLKCTFRHPQKRLSKGPYIIPSFLNNVCHNRDHDGAITNLFLKIFKLILELPL